MDLGSWKNWPYPRLGRRGSGVQIAPPRPIQSLIRKELIVRPSIAFAHSLARLCRNCAKTPTVRLHCARTLPAFIRVPDQLFQSFALHLKFHLSVLLEDLRVALAQHLSHPLVCDTSRAEAGGVRRSEIVDAEVSDTCPPECRPPYRLERHLITIRILLAREQVRAGTCDRDLALKSLDCDFGERNLRHSVRRLRVGNPDRPVLQVDLLLFHGSEFFVNPKLGLGDNANHAAQLATRLGAEDTEYSRAVGARWLISAREYSVS